MMHTKQDDTDEIPENNPSSSPPQSAQHVIECGQSGRKNLHFILNSADPSFWAPTMSVSMSTVVFGDRCASSLTSEKMQQRTAKLDHFDHEVVYSKRGCSGVVSECLYEDILSLPQV
eukprot:6794295-Ditylum_brightwellii.AAC.1